MIRALMTKGMAATQEKGKLNAHAECAQTKVYFALDRQLLDEFAKKTGWRIEERFVELFPIPLHGASFWISARFDVTTIFHFTAGLAIGFVFGSWIALAYAAGLEVQAGTADEPCMIVYKCKQGFNLIDFAAIILGGLIL